MPFLSPHSVSLESKRSFIPRLVRSSDSSPDISKASSPKSLLKPLRLPLLVASRPQLSTDVNKRREEVLARYRISSPVLVSGTGPMAVTDPHTWLDSARTPGASPPGASRPQDHVSKNMGASDVYVLSLANTCLI